MHVVVYSFLRLTACVALTFTLVITSFVTSPSAQTTTRADTVIFDLARPIEDPRNFNWYTPGTKREHGAHQAMWEPLFLLNYENGQLEPWLAMSLLPANNATPNEWVLTLRRGVTWSDGKPFKSDDVVFTVNELVLRNDSLVAQEAVAMRQQLAEPAIRLDDYRVRFKLRYPNPRFARENFAGGFFGSFMIMPQHIWRDAIDKSKYADPADFKFSNPIGTGPYKLKDISNTRVIWERDSNWWGNKAASGGGAPFRPCLSPTQCPPFPRQLEWRVMGSDIQSKSALEQNEIDAAREMTLTAFRDAQSKNNKIIGWDASSALAWNDPCARQIDINTVREPWTDSRLRRATSLLIDRKALATSVYRDTAIPSRTVFPEYTALKAFIEAVVNAGYGVASGADPTAAEALLTAAGWTKTGPFFQKGGQTLAVNLLVDTAHAADVAAAREVARQFAAAGIDAKTKEVSSGEYWGQAVPKGDYEMALSWLSCGSVAEPYTSLARYAAVAVQLGVRSPGFNNTGRWNTQAAKDYADVVTKELGLKVLAPVDERAAIVKAYKYLSDDMPVIPLIQSPRIIPFNTSQWIGWPVKSSGGTPMHAWSATHRLIHALRKAN